MWIFQLDLKCNTLGQQEKGRNSKESGGGKWSMKWSEGEEDQPHPGVISISYLILHMFNLFVFMGEKRGWEKLSLLYYSLLSYVLIIVPSHDCSIINWENEKHACMVQLKHLFLKAGATDEENENFK